MAQGELVPLVLVPRFSTYAGATEFVTIAMDVTQYQNAIVNAWRAVLLGTSPTFLMELQESSDQVNWTTCTGGTGFDPGQTTEVQKNAELNKRWFRIKVILTGTGVVATCWAVGFLEQRLS